MATWARAPCHACQDGTKLPKEEMLHSPSLLQKCVVLGSAAAKMISTPERPQFPGSRRSYLENNPVAFDEPTHWSVLLVVNKEVQHPDGQCALSPGGSTPLQEVLQRHLAVILTKPRTAGWHCC